MKNMISKIIETDKKAQEIEEQAKIDKLNVEQQVAILSKRIKEEYISRARKRISINEKTEKKLADEIWDEIHKKQLKTLKSLESSYKKNCDEWVNIIVTRTIGD